MTSFYSTAKSRTEEDPSVSEDDGEDGGDTAVWGAFSESLREVQSVLDRNRFLIKQVNENQHSRLRDNMLKNVSLIQELNGNISKVLSLYSHINSNFSTAFQQHPATDAARDKS
ncbi:protein EARLY FLOWERING 4 [Cajanus cajan]|uniref:Protein EARLY FLOWERING 4 domain-containing protein n=1 Tax=Cajanus cajan TaxID=3821 RepID=A0A151R1F7_CAJCA|nr:protein EARLY FLOWERING 4 [Cajanus cajan]KYP36380.1 hypothetical protein KK1_042508 [Cajanus cajan]